MEVQVDGAGDDGVGPPPDVSISAEGKSIKCHKDKLIAASRYFEVLIYVKTILLVILNSGCCHS